MFLWRDTALPPKIGPLDARAIFPLALWMFHWAWWTFGIAVVCIIILIMIQRTGMSPMGCLRALRLMFVGKTRDVHSSRSTSRLRKRCRW